jgi:hypothetical protein
VNTRLHIFAFLKKTSSNEASFTHTLKDSVSGFTLVEILVTVGLLVLFTGMAVTYNRSTDQQVALYREQGKIINKIYEVRALAVSTFNRTAGSDVPCGYGIHFDMNANQLTVYKDIPDFFTDECPVYPTHTNQPSFDDNGRELVEVVQLEGIQMSSVYGAFQEADVLFVPPDPQVYTDRTRFPVAIELSAPRVATPLLVSINEFGQIVTSQTSREKE